MSAQEDPPRLFTTDSGSSEELRLALGAAQGDLPSAARLEAILAAMPIGGPIDGPGGGGESGAPDLGGPGVGPGVPPTAPAAGAAAAGWMKLAGVLAVGATLAGVTYVATRSNAPAPAASSVAAPTASAPAVVTAPPTVTTTAEATAPSASAAPSSKPAVAAPQPSASAPARAEIEILKEAQAALAGSPSRALALCDEHARSHPKGSLGQEREMVRIQALIALGRTTEARALADAFKKANPSSAYAQRLDALFP